MVIQLYFENWYLKIVNYLPFLSCLDQPEIEGYGLSDQNWIGWDGDGKRRLTVLSSQFTGIF